MDLSIQTFRAFFVVSSGKAYGRPRVGYPPMSALQLAQGAGSEVFRRCVTARLSVFDQIRLLNPSRIIFLMAARRPQRPEYK
jgi:hypothetical protein